MSKLVPFAIAVAGRRVLSAESRLRKGDRTEAAEREGERERVAWLAVFGPVPAGGQPAGTSSPGEGDPPPRRAARDAAPASRRSGAEST